MSQLREYLSSATSFSAVDLDRVLTQWDIPLDENVIRRAEEWLLAQLDSQEQIVATCVIEGLTDDEWDEAADFVLKCLRRGIVAHEYINVLISRQQECNSCLS